MAAHRNMAFAGALRAQRNLQLRQALPGQSQPASGPPSQQAAEAKPSSDLPDQPAGQAVSSNTGDAQQQVAARSGVTPGQQDSERSSVSNGNRTADKSVQTNASEPEAALRCALPFQRERTEAGLLTDRAMH